MSQEFLTIPVPIDRVQEVYELLGRPKGATTSAPSSPPSPIAEATDAAVVARAYRESPPAMKKIFDHLAENAEHVVMGNDLAAAIGYHPHQMAGALGAFGRRWKNRYHGGENTKWPFASWWDFDVNTMAYKMSAETAEVIKAN